MIRFLASKVDHTQAERPPNRPSIWAIVLLIGSMGFLVATVMLLVTP